MQAAPWAVDLTCPQGAGYPWPPGVCRLARCASYIGYGDQAAQACSFTVLQDGHVALAWDIDPSLETGLFLIGGPCPTGPCWNPASTGPSGTVTLLLAAGEYQFVIEKHGPNGNGTATVLVVGPCCPGQAPSPPAQQPPPVGTVPPLGYVPPYTPPGTTPPVLACPSGWHVVGSVCVADSPATPPAATGPPAPTASCPAGSVPSGGRCVVHVAPLRSSFPVVPVLIGAGALAILGGLAYEMDR